MYKHLLHPSPLIVHLFKVYLLSWRSAISLNHHVGKIYETRSLHYPNLGILLSVRIWQYFEVLTRRGYCGQIWWDGRGNASPRYYLHSTHHNLWCKPGNSFIVISFKSASSIFEERLCTKSENMKDFKKCVREIIRKPYINKIQFNSYEQSYELNNVGVADFIYPAKYSITVDLSSKFSLNKVLVVPKILIFRTLKFKFSYINPSVTGIPALFYGSELCVGRN